MIARTHPAAINNPSNHVVHSQAARLLDATPAYVAMDANAVEYNAAGYIAETPEVPQANGVPYVTLVHTRSAVVPGPNGHTVYAPQSAPTTHPVVTPPITIGTV